MMDELNSAMNDKSAQEPARDPVQKKPQARPNERAGFAVMGHVKIFDPNTKEVIVETRA
jgi:hypothetical protein